MLQRIPEAALCFCRCAVAASLAGLCLVALLLLAAPLYADDIAAPGVHPEAPGSISGVILDGDGAPLAGIQISLYQQSPFNQLANVIRTTNSDSTGAYRFGLLAAGVYRIHFSDPANELAPQFYPAASQYHQAANIPVAGNQITNIDAVLKPGGRIVGSLTAAGGGVLLYSVVDVRHEVPAPYSPTGVAWESFMSVTPLGGQGNYVLKGLPDGVFRLCARGEISGTVPVYYQECYDDIASSIDNATDITVTTGVTVSGIDIVLGDGADLSTVTGVVRGPDGEALSGIQVTALLGDAPFYPIYPPSSFVTMTDVSGVYQIKSLAPGAYRLQFLDSNGPYVFGDYNAPDGLRGSLPINLPPRSVLGNVDVQLALGGQISGVVDILGEAPPALGSIQVYRKFGPLWEAVHYLPIESGGAYHTGGLPAGTYRLGGQGSLPSSTIYAEYYGYYGGSSLDTAADLVLAAGETKTGINFPLDGVRYDGAITGTVTADGAPLAGVQVLLYPANYCCDPLIQPLVYTHTNSLGQYILGGLAGGPFWVGFSDPTGTYATRYYQEQRTHSGAVPIFPSGGFTTTDINANLVRAGAISGQVRRNTGEPVANIHVSAFWRNEFGSMEQLLVGAETDAQGNYLVAGLEPGAYHICFKNFPAGSIQECFGSFYNVVEDAKPVTVEAGLVTSGIDQIWGPDFYQYLPLAGNFVFTCDNVSEIPAIECNALVALYNSPRLYGVAFFGWFESNTPCSWDRIVCTEEHITQLLLDNAGFTRLSPAIGDLAYLESLGISNNLFTTLPPELGKLARLRVLGIDNAPLVSAPPEFSNLTNLEELSLANSTVEGLPPDFGRLGNLQRLNLSGFRGQSLPSGIGALTNLQWLQLSGSQLSSLPSEIGNLGNLQVLDLSYNIALSSLPSEIGNLVNLQELYLAGTGAVALPDELGQLQNLRQLDLSVKELAIFPHVVGRLQNLQQLRLTANRMTTLPPEIAGLRALQSLDVSYNQLATISPEIGRLENLETLLLPGNQLLTVPAEIGDLGNLRELHLSGNKLVALPPEIGRLEKLEQLALDYNQLVGLPDELGALLQLRNLSASNNRLLSIPETLSEIGSLRFLAIDNNLELSGSIPLRFTRLQLEQFYYYSTQLCEPADADFQAWLAQIPDTARTYLSCPL